MGLRLLSLARRSVVFLQRYLEFIFRFPGCWNTAVVTAVLLLGPPDMKAAFLGVLRCLSGFRFPKLLQKGLLLGAPASNAGNNSLTPAFFQKSFPKPQPRTGASSSNECAKHPIT